MVTLVSLGKKKNPWQGVWCGVVHAFLCVCLRLVIVVLVCECGFLLYFACGSKTRERFGKSRHTTNDTSVTAAEPCCLSLVVGMMSVVL